MTYSKVMHDHLPTETEELLVMTVGIPVETETRNHQNASLEHYCYTNLLS